MKYINVLQLSSTSANIKKASEWPVFELSLKLLHLLDQNLRSPTLLENCGFKNCKLFLHPHYLENLPNNNKTTRIRAKPSMFRLPFKVYGAAVIT